MAKGAAHAKQVHNIGQPPGRPGGRCSRSADS
jgi:hypothetical protein